MNLPLTVARSLRASELIADKLGLHYPPERIKDMERLLGQAGKILGYPDRNAFIDSLLVDSLEGPQVELLASILTIGETYFYREPKVFEAIATHLVPHAVASRPRLPPRHRIWSAGCCTGEEAYTLAIVFDRIRSRFPSSELDLLATDINPNFLRKARAGIYRPWSFRGAPSWLQANYFSPLEGDRFQIRSDIQRKVRFAPLNLAEFNYPSTHNGTDAMDVILCRHVLMYFTPAQFSRAVQHLTQCLVEGGWLILSATESSHVDDPELVPTRIGDMIAFVKRSKSHRPLEPFASVLIDRIAEPDLLPQPPQNLNYCVQPIFRNAMPDQPGGRNEAAESAASSTSLARSAKPPDMIAVARSAAGQGHLTSALETCTRLIKEDKMNPATHYLRATILEEQGAAQEAERAHKRVLYLEPDFIAAHVSLANLARGSGRTTEARKHFCNALSLAGKLSPDCAIPEFEGITARLLVQIISDMLTAQPPPIRDGRATSNKHPTQRIPATVRLS